MAHSEDLIKENFSHLKKLRMYLKTSLVEETLSQISLMMNKMTFSLFLDLEE